MCDYKHQRVEHISNEKQKEEMKNKGSTGSEAKSVSNNGRKYRIKHKYMCIYNMYI